jgi:hypothetical protein
MNLIARADLFIVALPVTTSFVVTSSVVAVGKKRIQNNQKNGRKDAGNHGFSPPFAAY